MIPSPRRFPVPPLVVALALAACTPRIIPAADAGRPPPDAPLLPDAPALWIPPGADAALSPARDAAPCQPVTCTPSGGAYCGEIGDGCGGKLSCGECPTGTTCGGGGVPRVCGKPVDPTCQPLACTQPGGQLCGRVGDGCGRALDCGDCPGGQMCGAHVGNVCGAGVAVCEKLCKQQQICPAGSTTTVTGTVHAPTPARFGAADPLYNAVVYIPNGPVLPFASGVACEQCGQVSGSPLVSALTGPDGKFTITNAPVGDNIPLVIQIGRWRRQVIIPKVSACVGNPLPAEMTRLPRTKAEGDIPAFAIATGTYDPMDCLLRKIGIDESEFTEPRGTGRVHFWAYGGNTLTAATPDGDLLTGSPATLSKYDMVLLPCDSEDPKPGASEQALLDYASSGGRIFLTDWGYSWLRDAGTATGAFERTVTWKPDSILLGDRFTTVVDQTFPKGMAFAQWLALVGATPMPGRLIINDRYSGSSNVDAVVPPTQRWLYTEGTERSVQHFTFNAPIGAAPEKQCGRVVFSQFHVAADPNLGFGGTFPKACDNHPLTPQEKALEFMLFDASSCIQPDAEPPRVFQPPPAAPPPPPPVIE